MAVKLLTGVGLCCWGCGVKDCCDRRYQKYIDSKSESESQVCLAISSSKK